MKICTKCNIEKESEEFSIRKLGRDGHERVCKVCIAKRKSNYYLKNKTAISERNKQYYLHNKKNISERSRLRSKQRYSEDINYKLRMNLRSRLFKALDGNYKSGSAVSDLGCSIEELKKYLEAKFEPGMSWNNHGEWHIDHMKALANFDLTNREELLKACHYTNLQPMWAKDNLSWSNKCKIQKKSKNTVKD